MSDEENSNYICRRREAANRCVEIAREIDDSQWFKNQSLTFVALIDAIREEFGEC